MATQLDIQLKKDVQKALKKLKALGKELEVKERKKILRKAAIPLVAAAKANIPEAEKPVHRYSTGKIIKAIKTPPGLGTIIATYLPGNLKKSIRILSFRKSVALFVGPKVQKRNNKGVFGNGNKIDGWYAHFLEFGTVHFSGIGFMRRAADTTRNEVQRRIIRGVKESIQKFINSNKI